MILYDFYALVGEAGGSLGLFLGLSFLSMAEGAIKLAKKYLKEDNEETINNGIV